MKQIGSNHCLMESPMGHAVFLGRGAIIFLVALFHLFFAGPGLAKKGSDLGPYKIIVDRDPFDEARGKKKDVSKNGDYTSKKDELARKYQVYGIIIIENNRKAFIKVNSKKSAYKGKKSSKVKKKDRKKGNQLRVVAVGDRVDGWKVAEILGDGVIFQSGKESVKLGVFESRKKERKATAPVAVQTPKPKSRTGVARPRNTAKRSSVSKSRKSRKSRNPAPAKQPRLPRNPPASPVTGNPAEGIEPSMPPPFSEILQRQ